MKKTNKIISLLLSAAMMAGVTGCTQKKEEDTIPTLKWIIPGEEQSDHASVMEKVNEILVAEAGCKLEFQFLDAGVFSERMTMIMAGNEPFDLCFTGYVNPYEKAARGGGLLAIDEYLKDCPALLETVPDYALEAAKIDGEIYAIPNMQIMANSTGLFMLEDLVNEYGKLNVEEIKTINDIEPFLEWVKEVHPEKYPFQAGGSSGWDKTYDYNVAAEVTRGVFVIERDGEYKAENEFKLPHRVDEGKKMQEYYEKGLIREDIALVSDESTETKANKFAAWRAVYKPGAEGEVEAKRGTGVICVPVTKAVIPYNAGRTTMIGVGRNTKYPEKAVKVIELMNTNKELYNLVCFGIEGKHYNLTDGVHVEVIEDSGFVGKNAWMYGNQFNSLLLPGQEEGVWEKTEEFNNSAEVSPLIGFNFDNSSVRTEIAQIETVYNKYTAFYKGYLPMDSYYDDMMTELEQAGIERVIKEVDAQVQAFLAAK